MKIYIAELLIHAMISNMSKLLRQKRPIHEIVITLQTKIKLRDFPMTRGLDPTFVDCDIDDWFVYGDIGFLTVVDRL